jgi:hypothetical protein
MNKRRKWGALIVMLLCTTIINQLVIDTKSYSHINTKVKDLIEIGLLSIYAVIGFWGLSSFKVTWYKQMWLAFYTTIICFFVLAALIDWYIFHYSTNEQFRFLALKEILWSPLPYLFFLLFSTPIFKQKN